MKPRALILLVSATSFTALPGCFDEPTCPYGEVLVHDGSIGGDGVCVRRSYYSTPAGKPAPAVDAGYSPPAAATPASGTTGGDPGDTSGSGGGAGTPATPVAGLCGGLVAQSDNVRVVDKSDVLPALGDAPQSIADGSYALIQASFYRTGTSGSPVRSLKAGLDVKGPTLIVNAQDTSFAGLPAESMTFLLGSAGVVMKTCESLHASVATWFFPSAVGGTTQTQLQYDQASGIVRVIVGRADGGAELVFAR